ncbi:Uu.00g048640.m01.CDS01 [Anthostomella pinea]|uniref:Uu.00g048640.m01.CDS01 n=1 Tax=Anthostomella pinea TaxID=933095 RepID=A0AAI8VBT1_9PEZI|nr:Uu.00g048640.m01.CDS01 [Anthostomella pinea]
MPRRGKHRVRGRSKGRPRTGRAGPTPSAASLVEDGPIADVIVVQSPSSEQPQQAQVRAQALENGATTQSAGWGRVGPRELGAITKPWFDDSSPTSTSSDEQTHYNLSFRQVFTPGKRRPDTNKLLTPVKQIQRLQEVVESSPRKERAQRRELLRQLNTYGRNTSGDDNDYDNYDAAAFAAAMSSQQGKWREDQVLVICPGSHTTMAQLGCAELTPPAHRIPTRMFKGEESDEYRPYFTYKRKRAGAVGGAIDANGAKEGDDGWEWVEDRDSIEGVIYPIQGGRIVNMEAFLAFLDHVHSLLTTTYHNTPIVLMASPQWTRPDCESIARYIFEKTKTPALCLLNSAVAAQYGLRWPTMTVVDIGFEKLDVTCLYDNIIVSHKDLGYPTPVREVSGGEVFTQKLLSILKDKGFTYDMAEQLKKSPICEVLPYAVDQPELMELPTEGDASAASTEGPKVIEPAQPAPAYSVDHESGSIEEKAADEGVLDVANIVTSGNTREFLAKREREKAERAKARKAGKAAEAAEAAAAAKARLPNSKRKHNIFHYEDLALEDVQVPVSNGAPQPAPASIPGTATQGAPASGEAKTEPKPEGTGGTNSDNLPVPAEPTKTVTERRTKRVRKDIEIGLERFMFADRAEIDRMTETIYRAIQNIDEVYKRSACWENIVFVGNGSRLRGLKENIMQTLAARHLISPSTATIFTSELPSNMATPTGTGSQTPTGSYAGQLPTSSSVNPLLQAATTASLGVPGAAQAPGSAAGDGLNGHHAHGQTPMSIKQAPMPTYLAEWTKNGFEESMFLGSLIAARLAYCIHNLDAAGTDAQRLMSLNRVDYNENGPKAVSRGAAPLERVGSGERPIAAADAAMFDYNNALSARSKRERHLGFNGPGWKILRSDTHSGSL